MMPTVGGGSTGTAITPLIGNTTTTKGGDA